MRYNPNLVSNPQKMNPHDKQRWVDLERVVNGQLDFGRIGEAGNIRGSWITAHTPVTPDTDFTVTHNLGAIPVGIDVKQKSGACDVYNGSVPHTQNTVTLRATVGNVDLTLFIH